MQNTVGLYEYQYKILNYQNGRVYLISYWTRGIDNEYQRKLLVVVELNGFGLVYVQAWFLKSSPKVTLLIKLPTTITSATVNRFMSSPGTISAVPKFSLLGRIVITLLGSSPPSLACGIWTSRGMSLRPQSSQLPLNAASIELTPSPSDTTTATRARSEATFDSPRCIFLNHSSVHPSEIRGEHLVTPDRTQSSCKKFPPWTVSQGMTLAPNSILRKCGLIGANVKVVKFSFCAGGDEVFQERHKNALIESKWLLHNPLAVATPGQSGNGGASSVSIAGPKGAATNVPKKEAAIEGAFEDLEALMRCAKEMLALAEELSTHLSSTPTFYNSEAKAALPNSTQELGIMIMDMLTAAIGGSNSSSSDKPSDLYFFEHARHVAEYLTDNACGIHRQGIIRWEGGVIALVDLLAIYDKKAIALFEKLKLPVRVPKFWSGLLVVPEARSSDGEIVRRIMGWVAGPGWGRGVTEAQAAERFGWSIGVAAEELGMVEDRGAPCSEVGVEGVRF
ncbi:EAP30/Vps36 family-domain-containing protein [Tuber borchii]|uniref:Vacuolar protein-sorting-associated protein 36 n=1 Tax=Tuber borchii TaxID=42251 RepID=A0A2T7A2F2_TUBBO|nr:EAP30/Vps36 family-domain-containing protein [Tuber borchii]